MLGLVPAILTQILLSSFLPAPRVDAQAPGFYLSAVELLKLARTLGSSGPTDDAWEAIIKVGYQGRGLEPNDLTAYEENRLFIYSFGPVSGLQRRPASRLTRRIIFLKPSTFIIDDEVEPASAPGLTEWLLSSRSRPSISARLSTLVEDEGELACETLFPQEVTRRVRQQPGAAESAGRYLLLVRPESASARFVHVLHARGRGDKSSSARAQLVAEGGQLRVTVETDRRTFRLTLPPAHTAGGDLEISGSDGRILLVRRLLPSGKLPHGVKGVALLEEWDAPYTGRHPPLWDAGRPSGELIKATESGTVRPGRVVELGCGSGTDSVYLAGLGFDVTAIDIAPTALRLAQERAAKAGVRVRWLLADVLALPNLEPFDFIYDRGCYHEVRAHGLQRYLDSIERLSRPGSQFLLLAGNANESRVDYGPPRVTEQELRDDFSKLFDFEWLRESRFEIARPTAIGPLGWSALLRRRALGTTAPQQR
jgi:SAM-dependent methyltransferase